MEQRHLGSTPWGARLDRDQFLAEFYVYFDCPDGVGPNTDLRMELGFDSLQLFEIALFLEDVGKHAVPDEVLERIRTPGDVYDTYEIYAGHS